MRRTSKASSLSAFGRLTATICFAFTLPGLAMAQGRPDSLNMTCAQAAGMVSSRGAVVIGTGPNLYDRYVATRAFCSPTETTDPAWVATSDQRRCFIGYTCKEVSTYDRND